MTEKEGKEQDSEEEEEVEMDEVCMHAAFVERFDAGMEKFRRPWEGKGKGKAKEKASVNSKGKGMGVDDSGEISRISCVCSLPFWFLLLKYPLLAK
jgi:hypothetical protein